MKLIIPGLLILKTGSVSYFLQRVV